MSGVLVFQLGPMLNTFDYVLIVAAVVASITAALATAILRRRTPASVLVAGQGPESVANAIYGSLEMRETFKPSSPLPMKIGDALASFQFGPEFAAEVKISGNEDDHYRWIERQSSDAKKISPAVRVRASESLAAQAA